MKIAFTGASGTGKTTLARAVAERYHLHQGSWGARLTSREMGLAHPGEVTLKLRAEFQLRLAINKYVTERAKQDFVIDRAADDLIYSELEMLGGAQALGISYQDLVFLTADQYDVIFLCKLEDFQNLGNDPCRKTDPEYHLEFERLLLEFYSLRQIPIIRVTGANREERIQSCFTHLDSIRLC